MAKFWPADLRIDPRLRQAMPVAALALVCGFVAFSIVLPNTNQVTHGFIGHYTAARLLVQGEFGPQVYDDEWFIHQVQVQARTPIIEIFTPNLPTVALLALPFVGLDPLTARNVWIWTNFVLLLLAAGLLIATLARPYGLAHSPWLVSLALLSLSPALEANFAVGQTYILLLLCFILVLRGWVTRNAGLVGWFLGLAFLFKTSGLIFWLLLGVGRCWRAILWLIGTLGLAILLSLPWIGFETWAAYPQAVAAFSQRGAVAVTAYQTTAGFFKHLFQLDLVWNPAPLIHVPGLAWLLTMAVSLLATAVTLWLGRPQRHQPDNNEQLVMNNEQLPNLEPDNNEQLSTLQPSNPPPHRLHSGQAFDSLTFATLMPLAIVLLPVAEEHHYVLLLIPLVVVGAELFKHRSKFELVLFAAALLLLLAPISFKSEAYRAGWWALLAYPRLYAAWLIWYLGLRRFLNMKIYRSDKACFVKPNQSKL